MVADLGYVEAPADFDRRLRARLASEERGTNRGFSFAGLSFGVPTVAVAALMVVIGGVFVIRSLKVEPIPPTAISSVSPEIVKPPAGPNIVSDQLGTTAAVAPEPAKPQSIATKPRERFAVNQKGRNAIKEFSSSPAEVVKQNESVAELSSAFAVDSSQQSLKLSFADGSGVYRTISVPRVSFGSQRSFGEQSTFIKASSNGIW
jgi:hypothetical protein